MQGDDYTGNTHKPSKIGWSDYDEESIIQFYTVYSTALPDLSSS